MPNDTHIAEYFRKCFFSVDGLWFMKTEEASSFEKALETDVAVWRVLPKIQARTLKKLLGLTGGMEDLHKALDFKLSAEGFDCRVAPLENGGFTVTVDTCPWVELIAKAGRQHLAERIADAICTIEHELFAREFGKNIRFSLSRKGCIDPRPCLFAFHE